jgi:signal transduction histidine kinase
VSPIPKGLGRLRIDAKWRIAAASATIGLLMVGALALTVRSHDRSTLANDHADAHRTSMLAAERALSAFWQEREATGEYLAFRLASVAGEIREKRLRFRQALGNITADSPAELAQIGRARAANEKLIAIFENLPALSGGTPDLRTASRLHNAEVAVLTPIGQLTARNRRDSIRAEAVAAAAERAAFRSEMATSLLGLAAVAWFTIFAVRLVRRIDNQNVELQLAAAVKDEFIGTVSHELRTPLTSMHGFVELLLDEGGDPLTDQQRSFLATVQRGSIRLARLVNDLLLTAQLRAGRLDIRTASTDVVEIARQSVDGAQAAAGAHALQLSLSAPAHPVLIDGDVIRLGQAIDNVISNAIKFTPEGGRVDVTVARDGPRVILTVDDTGMGMSAEDIVRLFERFFRTDSAQAKQIQGTGLGLPIVKAIVEAHDGFITVTSEPNVGTSFVISLPVGRPIALQHPVAA